jgi:Yip1 domain
MHRFLQRIRNILIEPRREWPLIASEPGGLPRLLRYVAILALIPAVAGYIGSAYIGTSVSAGRFHDELPVAIIRAIISYLFSFAIVYLTALLTDAIAPLFGGRRSFTNALKLTVYSYTPVWLIGIVLLVPSLRFVLLLGLYALRLLWTGLPPLMGPERSKVIPYAVSIAAIAFAIVFALAIAQGGLMVLLFG